MPRHDTPFPLADAPLAAGADLRDQWGLSLQPAGCPRCGVAHLVPPDRAADPCPACFGASLQPQPARLRQEPPELVLPFASDPGQVRARLSTWMKDVWLRPRELDMNTLLPRLRKVYLPMWLVDGSVAGSWQAQAGFDYQVVSSQDSYESGQWTTQQITRTRIRWEPRAGGIERDYQNLAAPALEEHDRLMARLGEYRWHEAVPYSAEAIRDSAVRVPSLHPQEAWPLARSRFEQAAAADCRTAAGAQHFEEFTLRAEYGNQSWTWLLLPLYATAYRDDDGRIHPILVNGQTGQVSGVKRASQRQAWMWAGALAAAAVGCLAVGIIASLLAAAVPPVLLCGGSLLLLGLALGISAPGPAIWAAQFNRRSTPLLESDMPAGR